VLTLTLEVSSIDVEFPGPIETSWVGQPIDVVLARLFKSKAKEITGVAYAET
jgi:hypothetical protein